MKALIIADNNELIAKLQDVLEDMGFDTIIYRWLIKALDNLEEISPELTVVSVFDYPRHWKTLVQYGNSGICRNQSAVILIIPEDFSEEETKKASQLGVEAVKLQSDYNLEELKAKIESLHIQKQRESKQKEQNTEVPTVEYLIQDLPKLNESSLDEGLKDAISAVMNKTAIKDSTCTNDANETNESEEVPAEINLTLPTVDNILNLVTVENIPLPSVIDLVRNIEIDTIEEKNITIPTASTEEPEVKNVDTIALKDSEESSDIQIETVDTIALDDSEESINVQIASVDTIAQEAKQTAIDTALPNVDSIVQTNTESEATASETLSNDCISSEEYNIKLESVDTIAKEISYLCIPSVDSIALNVSEKKAELSQTLSIDENCKLPTVDMLLNLSLDNPLIPSVDTILSSIGSENVHHSLLRKIQDLYE